MDDNVAQTRLAIAIKESGLNDPRLANLVGTSRQQIGQWKLGHRPLPLRWAKLIAPHVGRSWQWLLGEDGPAEAPLPPSNVRVAPDAQGLPAFGSMARDLPVLGTAEGGPNGAFEMDGDTGFPVDLVRRPAGLVGAKNAFGLYTVGDSMEPWRHAGELIYVHPDRPARPGDHVVVVFKPDAEGGIRRALVKKLHARQNGKIVLLQYNPRKEFEVEADTVQHVWRVVEWQEAMGV